MPRPKLALVGSLVVVAAFLLSSLAGLGGASAGTAALAPSAGAGVRAVSPLAIGGPTPVAGPASCAGSTVYSGAQIVIHANGTVTPANAPIQRAGSVYTLDEPVNSSILILGSQLVFDGARCPISYVGTATGGNNTTVEVQGGSNVTVEAVEATGSFSTGIALIDTTAVTVINSSAQHATQIGIAAERSADVNVTRDNVSFSRTGIYFDLVVDGVALRDQANGSSSAAFESFSTIDVQYWDNVVLQTDGIGLVLEYDTGTVAQGNNFSNVAGDAIYEYGGSGGSIRDNDLHGTATYGVRVYVPVGPYSIQGNHITGYSEGIYLEDTYTSGVITVQGNSISDPGTYGIYLEYTGPVNLTGNRIAANATSTATYAIYAYYTYSAVSITGSTLVGGFPYGIYFESGGGSLTLSGNVLGNTTEYGLYAPDTYGLVVTHNDFAVNRTNSGTGISIGSAYPGGAFPTVISDNRLTGGWGTGINLAASETTVGIVGNDLVGTTSVGIDLGNTAGTTSIVGNDLSANATTARLDPSAYGIYVYSASSAPTGPITVLNNSFNGGLAYGIYLYSSGSGITVNDNSFLNVNDSALYDDATEYGPVVVTGNTMSLPRAASDAYGIYLNYVQAPVTITNNSIGGAPYYGIDLDSGSSVNISGNVITDPTGVGIYSEYAYGGVSVLNNRIVGNGSSWSLNATAIYVYDSGGGNVSWIGGNTISGGLGYGLESYYDYSPVNVIAGNSVNGTIFDGIYLYDPYGPTSIVDNAFSGNAQYGIYAAYLDNLTVSGNQFTRSNVSIEIYDTYGPVAIADNNASGSRIAIELSSSYFEGTVSVIGNDFAHSGAAYLNNSVLVAEANTFLGTPVVAFAGDSIQAFYHNNLESGTGSRLNFSGSVPVAGVLNAPLPIGGNYWTGYTPSNCLSGICSPAYLVPSVGGSSGYYDEYPLGQAWTNYAITFAESGLPVGTTWSVSIAGTVYTALAPEPIVYAPSNAEPIIYPYSIAGVGAYSVVTPASGSFVANGTARTISVSFARPAYSVTFEESGLAVGTVWYVNASGNASFASRAFSVSVAGAQNFSLGNLSNGTYSFRVAVGSPYYGTKAPAAANFTVAGAAVTVAYAYVYAPPMFNVTFSIVGLSSGASWSVAFDGHSSSSVGSTNAFVAPAGHYTFQVTVPSGFAVTPSNGTVTVVGGSVSVYLAATPVVATSPTTGGSTVSSGTFYALLAGLVVVLLLAIVGWVLYARRGGRSPPPSGGSPPAGAAGLNAWDGGSAPGGSSPGGPEAGSSPPPPPSA
jgi:parallel beta-helix repeat protein